MRAWGRCGPAAQQPCWQSNLGRLGAMHLACRVHSSISRASDASCDHSHPLHFAARRRRRRRQRSISGGFAQPRDEHAPVRLQTNFNHELQPLGAPGAGC